MALHTIHLERLESVWRPEIVRSVIRVAFDPLVRAAGYELNLVSVPATRETSLRPDVSLEYRLDRDAGNPRDPMLAAESGVVLVGSILHMRVNSGPARVCSTSIDPTTPLRGPRSECHVDYAADERRLFARGETRWHAP